MSYSTYWSILDTPSKTIQSNLVFLFFGICSGVLWFIITRLKKNTVDGARIFLLWGTGSFTILGFVGFITLTFFYPDKSKEKTLLILNSPNTPKVEGVISNFERTYRRRNETIERFTVDSVQFAYGNALLGKFNSFSQTNNNVIFNGQKVRITYSFGSSYGNNYNSILRLEIAE